jgi:hypothetical protein
MGDQFGSTNNALTVSLYACPVCGAAVGMPCTVVDGRGVELRAIGATHTVRAPISDPLAHARYEAM